MPELTKIFTQILEIASQMKVLKLGTVSLDGTKIKANASRHKAFSYDYACKLEQQLKAEVAELFKKAEAADQADIPDGMSIPEEIIRREERLKAIAEAKAEIERRAALRHAAEQEAYEKKIAERSEKEQKTGKKPKGSAPKPPTPGPTGKDQVNLTDSESRIMPSGRGFEQAYNAQATVDNASMLIVADCISQNPNDKQVAAYPFTAQGTEKATSVAETNTINKENKSDLVENFGQLQTLIQCAKGQPHK